MSAVSETAPMIRLATLADARMLTAFAEDVFRDAFGKENDPADLAMYIASAFSPERQAAEIADPSSTILLAECVDVDRSARLTGYAHLVQGESPDMIQGPAPLELKRFYVARSWHGRGVAQALMEAVLATARSLHARTLWLGVWERNPRAIAFYGKSGFRRIGEHEFMLGRDRQTDWLMARDIEAEA